MLRLIVKLVAKPDVTRTGLTAADLAKEVTRLTSRLDSMIDGIKGIGPALSGRILKERKKAPFADWQDLIHRVRGIRAKSAAKLSDAGLTVNDTAYLPIATSPK